MYALSKRNIASGHEYNAYFPPANNAAELVNQNGNLGDTTRLMQEVIAISVPQTAQIAPLLRGRNLRETCENIFDFVYKHINYRRDDKGKEQVRSAARTWHDRHRGVDCDCYSVFISSILINLGIAHAFRIAKYDRSKGFQHVYIVVPEPQNPKRYYTIDPVLDNFDQEHQPLLEYRDYPISPEKYESFRGLGEPITAATGIVTGTISLIKTISGLFGDKRPKTLPPEQIAQVAAMAAIDNHFTYLGGENRVNLSNSELYRAVQVIFEEIGKVGKQIDPTWTGAVYWMLGQDKAKGNMKQTFDDYRSTEWPLMLYPFFQAGRVFTPQNLRTLYRLRKRFKIERTDENGQWIDKALATVEEDWKLYKEVATQYRAWQAAEAKKAAQGNLGWLFSPNLPIVQLTKCKEGEVLYSRELTPQEIRSGDITVGHYCGAPCKIDVDETFERDISKGIYICRKRTPQEQQAFLEAKAKQEQVQKEASEYLKANPIDFDALQMFPPGVFDIGKKNPDGTFSLNIGVDLRKEIENWFANGGLQIEREPFDYIPDVATPEASTYEVIAAMQNAMLAAKQKELAVLQKQAEAAQARSAAAKSSVPETPNTKNNDKALLWIGLGTAGLLLIGATAYYVTNKNKNT